MFSKACEYALKIMIYLCSVADAGKLAGLKDIAKAIDSPEAFTAKILQQLVRANLLDSLRGPSGGFKVVEQPITLLEVVNAIDGEGLVSNCVLGLKECGGDHPCPAHDKFVAVRDHLRGVLSTTHLADLKGGVIDGNRFLRI
ncbi:MAG: transcriptional regulator [Flammeovirgaceae bacterium]|nr:transcriptional regulator [Flammeovirgaceae bacterium]MBE61209.1 transcriptional regulator [Flammeovirgaceae bacterium]MBR07104.1 transcriptional regulator [Rickettsiales bacterium]|tara:strand:- start:1945 stop:2370 length:426 start_codon:yes stop_codon:yes gene_type:complete